MNNFLKTNEYLQFLAKNCGVRGYDFEERTPECARPDVDVILKYLVLLDLQAYDKLLEIGCGLGRIIKEVNDTYGIKPYGIDSSEEIIGGARQRVAPIAGDLRVSSAERIDHENDLFDKVLCWGVFDLTTQENTLVEMCRVTKPGGLIMVTGKNDNYHDDDQEGQLSEVDSRAQNIPNHFTDFNAMLGLAQQFGLKLVDGRFFQRRGDFMNDVVDLERPEKFYEYLVLFKKESQTGPVPFELPEIGSLFSKTYLRHHRQ